MKWYERPENADKVECLKKMYKNTKNDEIMLKLDISFSALHRAARALGLTKSCGCSSRKDGTSYPSGKRVGGANYCGPEKGSTIPARRETDYIPSDYGKDDTWMFGPQGLKGLFAENKRI
jgi:hypothetical protein